MRRCAIVTGVSTGLGEALAARLLARGYEVLGVGRRTSPRLAGAAFTFVAVDLAHPDTAGTALADAFATIAAERPGSVCLVNNAATIDGVGVLGTLTAATIATDFDVNLAAPVIAADSFCRTFTDAQCARRIINVSSGAAQTPIAGASLYSIAKAGIEMLTRALAAEHGAHGLVAVTLRPGIIDTPMQQSLRTQSAERLPQVTMFRDFHASGRLVPPDEVAAKVVARLVEGEVDNGRTYSYAEL
ncbi:MAG TPA: SDR family NAD(P)-dependent oxidoreductase [Casimicrobiaceae bacterium]